MTADRLCVCGHVFSRHLRGGRCFACPWPGSPIKAHRRRACSRFREAIAQLEQPAKRP
jgi:hypothetical protein